MLLDPSISLIFGGCCSNVWTLEALLKYESAAGLLVTFFQLFLTALFALPSQLTFHTIPSTPSRTGTGRINPSTGVPYHATTPSWLPTLRRTDIPLRRLLFIAFMFTSVNVLNNWAFAFDISVPLHIVLRSFGSATTMTIGYLFGKRYTSVQVGAVGALTVGVVISAWADAQQKGANTALSLTKSSNTTTRTFLAGLFILFAAQVISAFMGVFVESTYARYGRAWRENLFYSHMFGLTFAVFLWPTLSRQFNTLWSGPPIEFPITYVGSLIPGDFWDRMGSDYVGQLSGFGKSAAQAYKQYGLSHSAALLLANGITQVACISGVNRLSAQTTALTVTVVLNIRKLVSFLLSCLLFGNKLSGLMVLGATIVFGSGAVYGWDSANRNRRPATSGQASGKIPLHVNTDVDKDLNVKRRTRKSVSINVHGLGLNGGSGSEYPSGASR